MKNTHFYLRRYEQFQKNGTKRSNCCSASSRKTERNGQIVANIFNMDEYNWIHNGHITFFLKVQTNLTCVLRQFINKYYEFLLFTTTAVMKQLMFL